MKNKKIILFGSFFVLMFFSCKSTIKDKIDDGDFKFWFSIDDIGSIHYLYFGNDGNFVSFIKNKSNGFHRYGSVPYEDDLPSEKWDIRDDTLYYGYHPGKIIEINENRIVVKHKNWSDTLYSCYDGMIPNKYYHKW